MSELGNTFTYRADVVRVHDDGTADVRLSPSLQTHPNNLGRASSVVDGERMPITILFSNSIGVVKIDNSRRFCAGDRFMLEVEPRPNSELMG